MKKKELETESLEARLDRQCAAAKLMIATFGRAANAAMQAGVVPLLIIGCLEDLKMTLLISMNEADSDCRKDS